MMTRIFQQFVGTFFLYALASITLVSFIGSYFCSGSAFEIQMHEQNVSPNLTYWFGTDDLGRDLFSRICIGTRTSLFIGVFASLVEAVIGIILGSSSAYIGGKIDWCLSRFFDVLHTIPYPLIVLFICSITDPGIISLLFAITITGWISIARLCRAKAASLMTLDFMHTAKSLGASHFRLIVVHLIPNILVQALSIIILTIPATIFLESFLSFLGLGIQAPMPSLGNLLAEGLLNYTTCPWQIVFPSLFISIIAMGIYRLERNVIKILNSKIYETNYLSQKTEDNR